MSFRQIGTWIDTRDWRRRYREFQTGWPSDSRPDIRFFETAKAQYRYRMAGAGPVVVFTADPPVSLELYDALIDIYSKSYRIIVVETAGMGFSAARGNFRFRFHEANDDMAEFLNGVCGEPAILAFSCVAGLGAVDIAVRHSDLVSALFLIQTTDWKGFQSWKMARDPKGLLHKPLLGQLGLKRLARDRAPDWLRLAVGRKESLHEFCACADKGFEHGMLFSLASIFQNYLRDDPNLPAPRQPVHLLWGRADRSHDDTTISSSACLARHPGMTELEDVGHFPELEDVMRVFNIFDGFVRDLHPPSPTTTGETYV